jgi:response regulator of citrate/malate metabolism
MNFLALFKNWKNINTVWNLIEPFILKLVQKNVPNWVTKLYENLAKYSQPAIDSLFELKTKIKTTPTEVDNYCFNQGVNALETFANYLLSVVADLRKE